MNLQDAGPSSSLPPFETGQRERVRISLTPLIDVVFILLVFFMLASSYVQWLYLIHISEPTRPY